jgi:NCS1 family nucleobase:cation symporter-1
MIPNGLWCFRRARPGLFLVTYTNFILLLMYVLVPWTAINLVDFYLVRRGDYDVEQFFLSDGGRYGRFNWIAVGCYLLGILIEVPFVNTTMFTGPAATALGGVDISWIIGLIVISPLYYLVATRLRPAAARPEAGQFAAETAG